MASTHDPYEALRYDEYRWFLAGVMAMFMARTGRGQPRDRETSLAWLRKAAAQRYPAALAALAAEEAP